MEENSKEKKEVKKITYEEVCEEVLLALMDEKMSADASSLSRKELRKAFYRIKKDVLKNPLDFEKERGKLIGEYKSNGLYDEDTDPKVIETRDLMAVKSTSPTSYSSDTDKINFGC
ncbi:hypothetical protein [Sulfuricurvum sp.]|uniref:hypothetical protein n=1 Tax=Sulfuricurvum sp. TaxID=2025608 RepID=UPI002D6295A1|nr:hypothetical protein [Sulfuricurvum sp.]HZF70948.1 hypothetical protein [Sulfuricurvum sp.]